nr:MAG TPA: Cytochrome c [Caudoviricetes sp.]
MSSYFGLKIICWQIYYDFFDEPQRYIKNCFKCHKMRLKNEGRKKIGN